MEEQSSPARTTAPELNDGEGVDSSGWEADLGSGEALRPEEGSGGGGGRGQDARGGSPFIAARCVGATWTYA
jgi:hypothetical protein